MILRQDDPILDYMIKFQRGRNNGYTLITPASPLLDLEEFLKDNLFALGTVTFNKTFGRKINTLSLSLVCSHRFVKKVCPSGCYTARLGQLCDQAWSRFLSYAIRLPPSLPPDSLMRERGCAVFNRTSTSNQTCILCHPHGSMKISIMVMFDSLVDQWFIKPNQVTETSRTAEPRTLYYLAGM
jgi:hypothetical protein